MAGEPEPFCDVMQLPRSMCAHCRADRRVVTAQPPDFEALADQVDVSHEVGPLIQALYDSRCRGCGGEITIGDFIAYSADEDRYVCADCARA